MRWCKKSPSASFCLGKKRETILVVISIIVHIAGGNFSQGKCSKLAGHGNFCVLDQKAMPSCTSLWRDHWTNNPSVGSSKLLHFKEKSSETLVVEELASSMYSY
jgi:hypothetical protein